MEERGDDFKGNPSCRFCHKQFKRSDHLLRHTRTKHFGDLPARFQINDTREGGEKEKIFSCDSCDKKFGRKDHLTRHKQTVHGLRRVHTCKTCQETFLLGRDILNHFQSVHPNDTMPDIPTNDGEILGFGCELCNRTFMRKDHLKRHVTTVHEATAVLGCSTCDLKFKSTKSFKEHVLSVHQGFSNGSFCCITCAYPICGFEAVLDHVRVHHNQLSYPACDEEFPSRCEMKSHGRVRQAEEGSSNGKRQMKCIFPNGEKRVRSEAPL